MQKMMHYCASEKGATYDVMPTSPPGRRKLQKQLTRIMKVTTVLLTLMMTSVYAASTAQVITFSGNGVSLAKVFSVVEQQTGYVVFYNKGLLANAHTVSIAAQQMPLENFISAVLKEEPLQFMIVDNTVVLSRKALPANSTSTIVAPQPITGYIRDTDGKPLPGASVLVKGKGKTVIADVNGRYSIDAEPGDILQISYVGFSPREITAGGEHSRVIILQTASMGLDGAIVVGYGINNKRNATGSISAITAKDIAKQPVTNPLLALQGRIPGLQISQQSGVAGSGIAVQIRAANSLMAGTLPFYIVDGVPFTGDALYLAGGNTVGNLKPAFGSSPLNIINPSDIESISILKDADATAIYGSRGANGVVLITTQKGKAGRTRLNATLSKGFSKVPNLHRVKTLSPDQYFEIRNKAFTNANVTPTTINAPDLKLWDTQQENDWQKLFFGKTAQTTDAALSLSGGTQQINFLLSGTYHKEDAVIPGSFNYQRGGSG